jgi:AraC family transcriptional regulator
MVHVGSPIEMEGCWSGEPRTVHRLAPGAVTLFPAWEPYMTRWDRPLEYVCVRLAPRSVGALTEETGTAVLRHQLAVEDKLVPALVMALRKEAQDRSAAGSLYVESLGAALIAHLVREYGSGSRTEVRFRGGLPPQRLRRVQDYIEANLSAELHLPALARVAEVSVRHFVRAFKESTGVSPHQFVLGRRMERAKGLLASTALTVADVALRCGFGSPSRFAAAFRQATDISPAAYRKVVLPG